MKIILSALMLMCANLAIIPNTFACGTFTVAIDAQREEGGETISLPSPINVYGCDANGKECRRLGTQVHSPQSYSLCDSM